MRQYLRRHHLTAPMKYNWPSLERWMETLNFFLQEQLQKSRSMKWDGFKFLGLFLKGKSYLKGETFISQRFFYPPKTILNMYFFKAVLRYHPRLLKTGSSALYLGSRDPKMLTLTIGLPLINRGYIYTGLTVWTISCINSTIKFFIPFLSNPKV